MPFAGWVRGVGLTPHPAHRREIDNEKMEQLQIDISSANTIR